MVPELTETQLLSGLVAIAVILIVGRGSAEAARLVKQPEVLGELIGGFVLGPSVLGALFPSEFHAIFENAGVGDGLSILSWIGAILVLFLAGLEVDVHILRQQIKPGAFTAVFAIVPSLVAGTLFSWYVLGHPPPAAFFLGIVLSVTGVSVASKILIERNELRRDFAQVILAAGIASEVLVWLLIAIVSAYDKGSPLIAGLKVAVLAVLFFAFMITIGRRVTFW
ncbi:MAG: cation:proton antiporter, partial [Chloroflexota bacterium]